jgi:hypothetical protein
LKDDLIAYIASFHPGRERVFTVREINSQVMAKIFDAAAREGLPAVLADLVSQGILERRTPTDYALSERGVEFVRERRGAA